MKRVQKRSLRRIADSDKAIIEHVREVTTDHIYNLMLAQKSKEKAVDKKIEKKEKAKEEEKKEKSKAKAPEEKKEQKKIEKEVKKLSQQKS